MTELQAYFLFDDAGARINARIHEMWNALMPVFEAKELYIEHYDQLMKARRILPRGIRLTFSPEPTIIRSRIAIGSRD